MHKAGVHYHDSASEEDSERGRWVSFCLITGNQLFLMYILNKILIEVTWSPQGICT